MLLRFNPTASLTAAPGVCATLTPGLVAWLLAFSTASCAETVEDALRVSPAGQWLAKSLDRLDVEHHWLRSSAHVAWRSGLELLKEHGKQLTPLDPGETHCSAFAATAADALGIYLLHPPEHSHVLLANAQHDWLASDAGRKAGWSPVDSAIGAQQAANRGEFVVAVFKNPDAHNPGHIAIVRPSEKSRARIEAEGPQVAQAGVKNYRSIDLRTGFVHHPGAWVAGGKEGVKFYAHHVDAAKLAGE
jgi:hypothetical protein